MKRIRIGNYVAGIRFNRTGHAIFGNFMIGKVADTLGVLNSIKGMQQQMLFADFDTSSLAKIFSDISNVAYKYNIGDVLLFMSKMKGQETHYFIISPFQYEPMEIRKILAEMKNVDGKFTGVYMRDGVNAIRFVPKIIGNTSSRHISLIDYLPFNRNNPRIAVKGMFELINEYYSNVQDLCAEPPESFDKSDPTYLTLREYETIRW